MADGIRLTCWSTPDRLGLGIQVCNLEGQPHNFTEEVIQIDTGYSEELLIPEKLFDDLYLERWQIPDLALHYGTTVTGQAIRFIQASVDVIVPQTGTRHRVTAQTFVGNTRFLIGRKLLRHFKVLIDGPGQMTCLLASDLP